nr:class I SAM-dependent methyltransferase [Parablautia muri]
MKKDFELHSRYFKKNYLKYMPKDKSKRILDLGCGMGQFLYFCHKYGYKDCTGVDVSKENIEFIKRKNENAQVYNLSIIDFLDDKEDYYDVIVLNDVIEHLTKEEAFDVLDAVIQAMRKDGVFLLKTPNMVNPFVSTAGRYIDITHEVGFTEISMKQMLRATGFKNIVIVGTDIYVLNPLISIVTKMLSKIINLVLYILSMLYGRTSLKIFEKDILAVAYKEKG